MTTSVPHATLLVIHGADQGSRFEIGDGPVGIGRGSQNPIRILDTEVSRQHAIVEREDDNYFAVDCDSSNGTFVNGVAIRRRKLQNGDQIQIGRSVLLFHGAPEPGDTSAVADRISLVPKDSPEDRSAIISQASHEVGQSLLDRAASAHPSAISQVLVNLRTLYRISEESVSASVSPDQLLSRILDLTIEVVGADRGCILLVDPDKHELVPKVFRHRRNNAGPERMAVSRSIVDYVRQNKQGVCTSDAQHDGRFEPGQSILQAGIREAMCVPMQGRFELLGVIYVDTTTPPERAILESGRNKFSEEQLHLLIAIGRQSALAVENSNYQQALVKAERLAAMGQTIAMLSHHIKNILQGVRGGSYLIDMGLGNHEEELVRKGWGIVEKNQKRIYELVMDMLTFSKDRQPVMKEADLNETVGEVCELMQVRAEECGVRFTTELAPGIPPTMFDAEGIHRAVLNVVTNAIDAVEGSPEGAVLVQTAHDADRDVVHVIVTDNGPGIPDEQLAKIFNIFESTKGSRGTGLGLAVSQKILREHGGQISVRSKVGKGCQFVVSWPRVDEEHRLIERRTTV